METTNIAELAKTESAISGIFAGFSLAIVVLLIERQARRSSDIKFDKKIGNASIKLFMISLFTSVFASFLFAVIGSEIRTSSRAFLMLMPAALLFALSIILIMLGLSLALRTYNLNEVIKTAKIITFVQTAIAVFQYTFTAGYVNAMITNISPVEFFSRIEMLFVLSFIPLSFFIGFALIRWRRYKNSNTGFVEKWFDGFVFCCILCSSVMGIPLTLSFSGPTTITVPFWCLLIFVLILSSLSGWATLYIPNPVKKTASDN